LLSLRGVALEAHDDVVPLADIVHLVRQPALPHVLDLARDLAPVGTELVGDVRDLRLDLGLFEMRTQNVRDLVIDGLGRQRNFPLWTPPRRADGPWLARAAGAA